MAAPAPAPSAHGSTSLFVIWNCRHEFAWACIMPEKGHQSPRLFGAGASSTNTTRRAHRLLQDHARSRRLHVCCFRGGARGRWRWRAGVSFTLPDLRCPLADPPYPRVSFSRLRPRPRTTSCALRQRRCCCSPPPARTPTRVSTRAPTTNHSVNRANRSRRSCGPAQVKLQAPRAGKSPTSPSPSPSTSSPPIQKRIINKKSNKSYYNSNGGYIVTNDPRTIGMPGSSLAHHDGGSSRSPSYRISHTVGAT
jgi:hypothetical protein